MKSVISGLFQCILLRFCSSSSVPSSVCTSLYKPYFNPEFIARMISLLSSTHAVQSLQTVCTARMLSVAAADGMHAGTAAPKTVSSHFSKLSDGCKGIWPVKTERWGAGVASCLEQGTDLHMAQLMPLPLTVMCFSKIQTGSTFLVPTHPGSPGQTAVKRVCTCVNCCFYQQLVIWGCFGEEK